MTEYNPPESLRPWSPEWYAQQKSTLGESTCRQLGFYVIPPEMRLSVVIPVYNEEDVLEALFSRLYPALDALGRRYEVVFVNDGVARVVVRGESFDDLVRLDAE